MRQRKPLRSLDDALPAQILTPDWYWACYRRRKAECPTPELGLLEVPEFAEVVDRAVVDLVDKHGIVPLERRDYLRAWLAGLFYYYFPTREAARNELTDKEGETCKRRIARLGEELREELKRLYACELHPDILVRTHPMTLALDQILSHARQEQPYDDRTNRPTTKENASKDVVFLLSNEICWFWVHIHGGAADIPFDFSKRSRCIKFAKYIYASVGEACCTDRMIVERLRTADRLIKAGVEHNPTRRFPVMLAPGSAPRRPIYLPIATQHMLRIILDAGNVAHLDEQYRIVAGTPDQPGRPVPATTADMTSLVAWGLVAGERGLILVTRVGRRLMAYGELVSDKDIALSDVDLAAWGRGEVDYPTGELREAIVVRFARVATKRRAILDLLLQEGLITIAEAREDVANDSEDVAYYCSTTLNIDFAAWARGDRAYAFREVRLAIAERWVGKIVTGRRKALEFLIDEGVIQCGEARTDL